MSTYVTALVGKTTESDKFLTFREHFSASIRLGWNHILGQYPKRDLEMYCSRTASNLNNSNNSNNNSSSANFSG
jgi:hypothetical protein